MYCLVQILTKLLENLQFANDHTFKIKSNQHKPPLIYSTIKHITGDCIDKLHNNTQRGIFNTTLINEKRQHHSGF